MFFSSADDELPDKPGRVTIPAGLRQYAGLDRDCAVIGANTRLEIWDAQGWVAYEAEQEAAVADKDESGVPVPGGCPRGRPCHEASDRFPSWPTLPRARQGSGRGTGEGSAVEREEVEGGPDLGGTRSCPGAGA